MTGFLASVKSCEEAGLALSAGAAIIDCKDPAQGALGALPLSTTRDIVLQVDGRRPVSATVGDLPTDPGIIEPAVRQVGTCNVEFVKIGFFDADASRACISTLGKRLRDYRLVAVFFADRFDPLPFIPMLADSGFEGVMIDTANKTGLGLTGLWTDAELREFVGLARDHTLLCGLAGKLNIQDIPRLLTHQADYLGFRGALCENGRGGALSEPALLKVRNAFEHHVAQARAKPLPY